MVKMNIIVLKTVEKVLMCGDVGLGAMQEPSTIAQVVHEILKV